MRKSVSKFRVISTMLVLGVMSYPARAQFAVGTWVQKSGSMAGQITMKVEQCCAGGERFTYFIKGTPGVAMMIESRFDGSEAPFIVGGKPSGQTATVKRIDERHLVTIIRMDGKLMGTSRSTLSEDGKTATVENVTEAYAGQKASKRIEIWVKL